MSAAPPPRRDEPRSPGARSLPTARRRGILSEETVRREGQPEVENPYWAAEEPSEHPNPEQGCIRRGLCCKSSPGWFAPGEVEAAAAFVGLSPDEFVRRHVVITSVEVPLSEGGGGETVEVEAFAPVKLGQDGRPLIRPATRADRLYYMFRGPCTFYDGAGCRIYGARPAECRRYDCTRPEENLSHEELGRMWLEHRKPT